MKQRLISIILSITMAISVVSAQNSEPEDSLKRELREVILTAKQPVTKLVGTTLVSTIAGSKLQDIGNALDVLEQLPMITVTDGAVSIVGKSTSEIYIDGRPMRSDDELIHLQSSNIKKIELLMAPGAMYASTTAAVLKITTRHNFIDGLSLTDAANVVARRKLSVNDFFDMNYHLGSWDLFTSGGYAHNNSLIKGTTTNTLLYDGKETIVGSSQHKTYPTNVGVVKAGFNYASGDQSFGAYYRYNPEKGYFNNIGQEWLNDESRITRDISTGIRAHSHLASVYYENTFKEKYLLHFDGDFKNSFSSNNVSTVYPDEKSKDVNSADTRHSSLWAGKLYLSFPIAMGNLIVGTQESYTHTTLNYRMLNHDISEYIPSSYTDARQTSAAAFATWDRSFGNLSLSAGLRYEYSDYLFKVNEEKDKDVSRTDNYLTPDISVGYYFNDKSQVSLSYKKSTIKPPYSQLTGSLSYVGLHEIEGGNPALKDEHMHDFQLFGMWNDFMLQADFTKSIDSYAFVKRIYQAPTLQLLMQPVNINVSAMDFYLVWNKSIKAWTPNFTLGMHKQWLEIESNKYNRPIFSYHINNTISLPKGFLLTLNLNGNSKGDMHTNRFGTTWFTVNSSISKSLFNKTFQIKFSATDIFNSRNNDWTMNTYGVFVDKHQTYDHRGVDISITYRFQPRQSKYKGKAASEAEMNRL